MALLRKPLQACESVVFKMSLLQGRLAVWTVKNKVETSFDETEFLEGAKDAWVAGAYADICENLCSMLPEAT